MRVRLPLRRRPWRRGPADSYPHGACVPPADLRQRARTSRFLEPRFSAAPTGAGRSPGGGRKNKLGGLLGTFDHATRGVTLGHQSPHGHSGPVTIPRLRPGWPRGHLGRSHRQVACPPRWPRGHPGGGHLAGKSPAGHSEKSPPGDLRLKSDPTVAWMSSGDLTAI